MRYDDHTPADFATAVLFAALVYGSVFASVYTDGLGLLWWPVVAGAAFAGVLSRTRNRIRIIPMVIALVAGLFAVFIFLGIYGGAFNCWGCRRGDFTNGGYFVIGLIIWSAWSAWALALTTLTAFAMSFVIRR